MAEGGVWGIVEEREGDRRFVLVFFLPLAFVHVTIGFCHIRIRIPIPIRFFLLVLVLLVVVVFNVIASILQSPTETQS